MSEINIRENSIYEEVIEEQLRSGLTLGDIVIIQCVICLALVVALIAVNIANSELAGEIISEFRAVIGESFSLDELFRSLIAKL